MKNFNCKESKTKTKKLLLINPVLSGDINLATAVPILDIPPLGLSYLAALTPHDWKIEVVDENVRKYNGEEADLVGLTSVTSNIVRAYELANYFKEKGTPVVMGGVHVSMLPNEALKFANSVVIGEAETVWRELIKDFENDNLKQRYIGEKGLLENMVCPRRDLYEKKYKIKIGLIQTARGCPMGCDFCSVSAFNGGLYRQRPVSDVLDEIESINSKLTFFIDDNILGYGKDAEQRAIKLFKGISERGLNIKWASQTSINFARNEEVLKYAQKSGCFALFIGFESLNEEALRSFHKAGNIKEGIKNYAKIIKKIQNYGIGVVGSFIFGSDSDEKNIFDETIQFVLDSKIDGSQATVLTPFPGTRLYQKLKDEGRILFTDYPKDWALYDVLHCVFEPKNMTPEELMEGTARFYRSTTSIPVSLKRAFNSFLRTRRFITPAFSWLWNRGYGSGYSKKFKN